MDEQQLEMIGRAGEVFMRYGIKSVTMDDLARELGISKKTLYKYFRDKNDLVISIIRLKLEMDKMACIQCMQDGNNAIDQLFNMSQFVLEHLSKINPSVFFDLKKYHPEAWKLMNEHKWDFILNSFKENLERGVSQSLYRDNMNIDIVARHYVSSIDTMMQGHVYPYPEFKLDRVFMELVRLQMRGLASDNGLEYIKQKFNHEINE